MGEEAEVITEELNSDQLDDIINTDGVDIADDDAEAEFVAGFDGVEVEKEADDTGESDDEPVEEEQEAEEQEEETTQEVVDREPAAELTEAEKLEKRLRRNESKFGELNSKYLALQRQLEERAKPKTEATAEQISAAIEGGEKFAELMQDEPSLASALKEIVESTRDTIRKDLPDFDALQTNMRSEYDAKLDNLAGMVNIATKHPGWQETANSKEFQEFAYGNGPTSEERAVYYHVRDTNAQQANALFNQFKEAYPEWKYGELLDSDDPNDSIALLDEFKESRRVVEKKEVKPNKSRLQRNVAATNSSSRPKLGKTEEEMFLEGFNS